MARKEEQTTRLPVVDVGARVSSRLPQGRLRIELLTDPWSVWCWGLEPIRRTIQLRHPDIEFRTLLGGMFEEMPRPEDVGFDIERFFAIVQRSTGMPIDPAGLRSDRPRSTYPACMHVHAVRLLAPHLVDPYLRALREAAYLDGLNISREEVGADVAVGIGIARQDFLRMRRSEQPENEFRQRIKNLQKRSLHGYPTILFTVDDQTHVVQGFQTLPAILGIARSLTGRLHAPTPDPPLEAIIPPLERVATREVAEVLGMSIERAYELCEEGEEKGLLRREVHSSGVVWRRKLKEPVQARPTVPKAPLFTPAP